MIWIVSSILTAVILNSFYFLYQKKFVDGFFLWEKIEGYINNEEIYSFKKVEKAVKVIGKKIGAYQHDHPGFSPDHILAIAGDNTVGGAIVGGLLGHRLSKHPCYVEITREHKKEKYERQYYDHYKSENENLIKEHLIHSNWNHSIILADDVTRTGQTIGMIIEIINKAYKEKGKEQPLIAVLFVGVDKKFLEKFESRNRSKNKKKYPYLEYIFPIVDDNRLFYYEKSRKKFLFPWKR